MDPLPLVCTLGGADLAAQRARYEELGRHVESLERDGHRLVASLGAGLDERLLGELIAVERECCPFFEIAWDAPRRGLSIFVADAEHARALDAIALSLEPAGRP